MGDGGGKCGRGCRLRNSDGQQVEEVERRKRRGRGTILVDGERRGIEMDQREGRN